MPGARGNPAGPGDEVPELSNEELKILLATMKHSARPTPNWNDVALSAGSVRGASASKRLQKLVKKIGLYEGKASTVTETAYTETVGNGAPREKTAPKKRKAAPRSEPATEADDEIKEEEEDSDLAPPSKKVKKNYN